jgi:hypothetical protein
MKMCSFAALDKLQEEVNSINATKAKTDDMKKMVSTQGRYTISLRPLPFAELMLCLHPLSG